MAVPFVAGGKPRGVRLIDSFYAAPVKKRSGIEKDDRDDANSNDHRKIDIGPCLPGRFLVGQTIECVGNHEGRNCKRRATKMDDVSFLCQNHPGHAHAGAPQVIWRSKFPETKQAQNE